METRKNRKSKKSNKRFRKTRSKKQRGGGGDGKIKLAILLITTHGNLDNLEPLKTQDIDINIHKINATTPGVCNYIEDEEGNGELLDMGQKMSDFIGFIKDQWITDGKLSSRNDLVLTFGSDAIAHQHIGYLSQSLRSFMPRIDNVKKETARHVTSGKIMEDLSVDMEGVDPRKYRDKIDEMYQLYKWETDERYMDKTYTIIPDERIFTASNPYNNTVLYLGKPGLPDSGVINMRYNLRSNASSDEVDDDYKRIKLSEILTELKEKGYTDTIIIDLSCNVGSPNDEGETDRSSMILSRNFKRDPENFPKYGGKKRKSKRKIHKK